MLYPIRHQFPLPEFKKILKYIRMILKKQMTQLARITGQSRSTIPYINQIIVLVNTINNIVKLISLALLDFQTLYT